MDKFIEIQDLPILDLWSELNKLLDNKTIMWHEHEDDQICINTTVGNEDNIHLGRGSLEYDWDNATKYANGDIKISLRETPLKEDDFTVICNQFKNTLFEEVYVALSTKYKLGRVRIMNMKPKSCLTWHTDTCNRIHYPIKTQNGCFMVINTSVQHLRQNKWYFTETLNPHTAFNGSAKNRYHLVACVLDND